MKIFAIISNVVSIVLSCAVIYLLLRRRADERREAK